MTTMTTMPAPTPAAAPPRVGPVFISGRQHCGNTMTTLIVSRMRGCYAILAEGTFFEHRARLDRLPDAPARAAWLSKNMRLDSSDPFRARIEEHLPRWAAEHSEADALTLYVEAMRYLTDLAGKTFWAQKGTSYIFHARQILAALPESRLVYIVRNPYDVCASKKRRVPEKERIVGWAISWNRGLKIAQRLAREMPDRVKLILYERFVREPEMTGRELSEFIGVPFDAAILDIPHINTAEKEHAVVEGTRGLDKSRAYYYVNRLTPAEIKALDMMTSRRLIREFYPDLPHLKRPPGLSAIPKAVGLIATGPFRFLAFQRAWSRKQGYSLMRREVGRLLRRRG
jgi:hypothetical protein